MGLLGTAIAFVDTIEDSFDLTSHIKKSRSKVRSSKALSSQKKDNSY